MSSGKHRTVFLSYARSDDSRPVHTLLASLRDANIEPWLSSESQLMMDTSDLVESHALDSILDNLAESLWLSSDPDDLSADILTDANPEQAASQVRDVLLQAVLAFNTTERANPRSSSLLAGNPSTDSNPISDDSTPISDVSFCWPTSASRTSTDDILPEGQTLENAWPSDFLTPHDDTVEPTDRITSIIFDEEPPSLTQKRLPLPPRLGQYQILRILGHGGFGIVCLAKDRTSIAGRQVVLKIPKRQRCSPEWRHQLIREARLWRSLSELSPDHILHLEDVKRLGSFTVFVTEYMDGGNILAHMKTLPCHRQTLLVIRTLESVCNALASAHRNGVVHGDIKPQNILISRDCKTIKLCDFGLSAPLRGNDGGRAPTVGGTPGFMAPESGGGTITPRTDIYSLGVTLFVLLTGAFPDTNQNESASCRADGETAPIHRNIVNQLSSAPKWLGNIIERCLAHSPDQRFQDAGALLDLLKRHLNPYTQAQALLVGHYNSDRKTVDYYLQSDGEFFVQPIEAGVAGITREVLMDLARLRDRVGHLALERASGVDDKITPRQDDEGSASTLLENAARIMLGREIRDRLRQLPQDSVLRLSVDSRLSDIPWELLSVDGVALCRRFAMARWQNPVLVRSTHRSALLGDRNLRILVVANTTCDLPGATEEARRVVTECANALLRDRLQVRVVDGTLGALELRCAMRSADILHYAGHGIVDNSEGAGGGSGWLLKGDAGARFTDVLLTKALADLWSDSAPAVVFANACAGESSQAMFDVFAQDLLKAGVQSVVGAIWPPPDTDATVLFATTFYRNLFGGESVGNSLHAARKESVARFGEKDLTWARYCLYGDPTTRIAVEGESLASG